MAVPTKSIERLDNTAKCGRWQKSILIRLIILLSFLGAGCTEPAMQAITYTISFNTRGGIPSLIKVQSISLGKKAVQPDNPTQTGYAFAGWFSDDNTFSKPYDFDAPVSANIVLYAKWKKTFTVTFDLNYKTAQTTTTSTVVPGKRVHQPKPSVRNGFTLVIWSTKKDSNDAYDFESAVASDFTLYAQWVKAYTVIFNYNYEDSPLPIALKVTTGMTANAPAYIPEREGYRLAGWYTSNKGKGESYNFANAVTSNFTLYAKWVTPFITVWRTTSADNDITLPLVQSGDYNFQVDWGDGSGIETITRWDDPKTTHAYDDAGDHTVTIRGTIVGWSFDDNFTYQNSYTNSNAEQLRDVISWGVLVAGDTHAQFIGAKNLTISAKDALDLDKTTSLSYCFAFTTNFNSPLNWDTSTITDMIGVFFEAHDFNQDLNWSTSQVTDMTIMFSTASKFNGKFGENWDTSNVTKMTAMFARAVAFTQDISHWNVDKVVTYTYFFNGSGIADSPEKHPKFK